MPTLGSSSHRVLTTSRPDDHSCHLGPRALAFLGVPGRCVSIAEASNYQEQLRTDRPRKCHAGGLGCSAIPEQDPASLHRSVKHYLSHISFRLGSHGVAAWRADSILSRKLVLRLILLCLGWEFKACKPIFYLMIV